MRKKPFTKFMRAYLLAALMTAFNSMHPADLTNNARNANLPFYVIGAFVIVFIALTLFRSFEDKKEKSSRNKINS